MAAKFAVEPVLILLMSPQPSKGATVYGAGVGVPTSDGADSITVSGSLSASYVQGNKGNDTIRLGGGINTGSLVRGGKDNDLTIITTTVTGSTVYGDLGSDSINITTNVHLLNRSGWLRFGYNC